MAGKKTTPISNALARAVPDERIRAEAARLGVVQRKVKVKVVPLVWTLVLAFQSGHQRSLAALREAYVRRAGHSLARSAFYKRLSSKLAALLKALVVASLEETGPVLGLPSGSLAGFRDLLAIDSTVIRLHDLLEKSFPGCRTNQSLAAAKLHMVMSVLDGSARRVKLTPERTSDITPWKRVGKWVEGRLLLFDLGYYGFHLFDRIDANGGFFLCRAKTNFNPVLVSTNRKWRGASVPVVGRRLHDVLPLLQREYLDVQVEVSFKKRVYKGKRTSAKRSIRLVAVRNVETGGYHCYLTNVPADRLPAEDIRSTYALRWQVELLFKAMASHGHLKQLPSEKKAVIECLIWASVLATIASQALYRLVRERVDADRHLPLLRWAALFGRNAEALLSLVIGHEPGAERALLEHLLREAPDPNRARRRRALPTPPAALAA